MFGVSYSSAPKHPKSFQPRSSIRKKTMFGSCEADNVSAIVKVKKTIHIRCVKNRFISSIFILLPLFDETCIQYECLIVSYRTFFGAALDPDVACTGVEFQIKAPFMKSFRTQRLACALKVSA
jgi:hypothetical protein